MLRHKESAIGKDIEAVSKVREFNLQKFKNALNDIELMEYIRCYFNYIFVDEDEDRPIKERCFIVVARKGFSLWLAGMLCGLCGSKIDINSKTLISERNWHKMSARERQNFVADKHVFIVDDSIVTGISALEVYSEIDYRKAKSRSVVSLISEASYCYDNMFQYYKDFFPATEEEKSEANNKILYAIYQVGVPFTADAPTYLIKIPRKELESWMCSKNGWVFQDMPLDFSNAGVTHNTFSLNAPMDDRYGANTLSRDMRVCYTESIEVDFVNVILVPWITFDAFNYQSMLAYLTGTKNQVGIIQSHFDNYEDLLLYRIIMGDNLAQTKAVVHRVISYLLDICITKKFEEDFLGGECLSPYILPTLDNEENVIHYHYNRELFEEMMMLSKVINTNDSEFIEKFSMNEDEHEKLLDALLTMPSQILDIPELLVSVNDLEDRLCGKREPSKNDIGQVSYINDRRRFPLICCSGEKSQKGFLLLEGVRKAVFSLHSNLVSFKDQIYLLNTMVPGEGSPLAFVKNYDFIYALYHLSESMKCTHRNIQLLLDGWVKKGRSTISTDMRLTLFKMTKTFWPSIRTIIKQKCFVFSCSIDEPNQNLLGDLSKIISDTDEIIQSNKELSEQKIDGTITWDDFVSTLDKLESGK